MSIYKIANLFFNIAFAKQELGTTWESFCVNDITCNRPVGKITACIRKLDYIAINRDIKFFHLDSGVNIINANEFLLVANQDYSIGLLQYVHQTEVKELLLGYFFYTHAVQRKMLQLHSSLVSIAGNYGLLFLGPSGIGKTTQAELWNQHRDALIINGDVVFVQEVGDTFLGWGTPWHGSSSYCENTNVPVQAMVVLKQSSENSIRELIGFEKVAAVSQSVFYPRWLENGMELCLETLDHLLKKVPVYELSCRPDEDAVRLTEETVFGKGIV